MVSKTELSAREILCPEKQMHALSMSYIIVFNKNYNLLKAM